MARILAIDYGTKRSGLAATDILQITANGLTTVDTASLWGWLEKYLESEDVETILIGRTVHKDGTPLYFDHEIQELKSKLEKTFQEKKIILQDEAFTSVKAREIILNSGIKKSKRKDKSLIDKISAVIILQQYLKHI